MLELFVLVADFAFCDPKGLSDWLWGLAKLNTDPEPAPVLAFGGGPAGVVELPNSDAVGLLVGVVVFSWPADDVLKPVLPNIPVFPVLAPPPKRFEVWL